MKMIELWQRIMELTQNHRGALVFLLVLSVLLPLTHRFDVFWLRFFSYPTATLASFLLGAPCIGGEVGYYLPMRAYPLLVSTACSGAGYFVLLVALLSGALFGLGGRNRPANRSLVFVSVFPFLYFSALIANLSRLLLTRYAGLFSQSFLPERFHAAAHLSVGGAVFLAFLFVTYYLVMRSIEQFQVHESLKEKKEGCLR